MLKNRNPRYFIADLSAFVIIITSLVVLYGWISGTALLKDFFLTNITMKAHTAISFLLMGLCILLVSRMRSSNSNVATARFLSILVFLLSFLVILEYALHINLYVDLFSSIDGDASKYPGRMALNTAFNMILASISILILSRRNIRYYEFVRVLLFFMGFICLLSIIGFFFDVKEYSTFFYHNPMTLQASILFLILFTGMLMLTKNEYQPLKKLEYQTIAGFSVALITIVVIGVISIKNSNKVIDANKSTNRTFHVLHSAEEVLSLAKDLETSVRGYVITKDSIFLNPYLESRVYIKKIIQDLRVQVGDYKNQKENIDTLETLIDRSFSYLQKLIKIRNEKGLNEAIKFVATLEGKNIMDQIRAITAEMKIKESNMLVKRAAFEDQSSRNSITILLLFVFVPFGMLVFIYIILRKNIIENYRNQEQIRNKSFELEQRYRILFNEMPDGFGLHEMIFDENNKPIDYRFVDLNPAFENLTGLKRKDVLGKTIRQIAPDIEQYWIDLYGDVVLNKKNIRYENYASAFKRYYEVSASPFGENQFIAIFVDITERKKSEEIIKASLKEKEVLLRELYHRTKNNMQVISSFLGLKSESIQEENIKMILSDMKNRIQTIALVHQKLYQSKNLSKVDLKDYITDLANLLFSSYFHDDKRVVLMLDLESINVLIDTAIPCGLVINELVSNSLKYAFPDCRKGELKISLKREEDDLIELKISDNGVGLPQDYDIENSNTLGLLLFKTIAEDQLQGEVIFNVKNGVSTVIRFRDIHYEERV